MAAYFSIAEQDKIRRSLLLYAKMHGIGVPRLSWRIVADNPAKIELPVKTLARFLAGKRVNDAAVAACAAFAIKVTDPLIALGETINRAFGTVTDIDIAGIYVISRNNIDCAVWIKGVPENFWLMTEIDKSNNRVYEGVVVHMCGVFVAFLKDRVFGRPRSYHFSDALIPLEPQSSLAYVCDGDIAEGIAIRRVLDDNVWNRIREGGSGDRALAQGIDRAFAQGIGVRITLDDDNWHRIHEGGSGDRATD